MDNGVGRVISLKKKHKFDFSAVKYQSIMSSMCALGIVLGVFLLKYVDSQSLKNLITSISQLNSDNTQKSFLQILSSSLVSNIVYTVALIFSGLCLAGLPFIIAVPIIKGLGTGLISAYMYANYAIDGLEYCVLMIYPASILMFLSIIIGGTESIYTSNELRSIVYETLDVPRKFNLKLYLTRYIMPFTLCISASLMSTVTAKMFSDLFKF